MRLFDRVRGQGGDVERLRRAGEADRSGMAHLQAGNLRQAKSDLQKAVELDPDNATFRHNLGLVFMREGRLADAYKELEAAISLAPANDTLRHTIGQILEGLQRQDAAAEQYRIASKLNSRSARNLAALASLELKRDNVETAAEYVLRALEIDANEPQALSDLADIRYREGNLAGAIEIMQRTISIRKDNPHDQYRLGILLEEAGDLNSAIDWLRMAHDALRGDPEVVFALGRTLMKGGRRSDALNLYTRVMAEEPANRISYEMDLSHLKLQYGEGMPTQGTKLRADVQPASSTDHESIPDQAVASKGVVGQPATLPSWWKAPAASEADEAIARVQAEVAADPNNSRLRRNLSLLYMRAGRLAEAKEQARLAEAVRVQRSLGPIRNIESTKG